MNPLTSGNAQDSGSSPTAKLPKRPREDLEAWIPPPIWGRRNGVAAVKVERDEVFWFDDGSVILEAGKVAFRVHSGVLSYHSEGLRELIDDGPRPLKMFKTKPEGSPSSIPYPDPMKLKLSDPPDELRYLLRIILLGEPFCKASVQMPFSTVAALVRLAEIYRVQALLDEGLKRIKSCFTKSLQVYDKVEKKKGSTLMSFVDTDAIAAVAIARLTNTPSILPLALYMCCQLDPDVIMNGVARANSVVDQLSPADRLSCLRARAILCNDTHVVAYKTVASAREGANDACIRAINKAAQELWSYEDGGLAHHHALQNWDAIIDRVAGTCCHKCVALLKSGAAKERRAVWDKLPKMFGVPYTLKA